MAVKYVNDFAFDSGFGFSGSSGKTPVKSHMRSPMKKGMGGAVKAPSIAPAMVEKRSQGLGGLAKETKKLAAYNKPHMEGKKGAKVAMYAKGGAVKKAHAKKEMPSFLKAKMMKKADGGEIIAPVRPGGPDAGIVYETMLRPDDDRVFGIPEDPNYEERMERMRRRGRGDDAFRAADLADRIADTRARLPSMGGKILNEFDQFVDVPSMPPIADTRARLPDSREGMGETRGGPGLSMEKALEQARRDRTVMNTMPVRGRSPLAVVAAARRAAMRPDADLMRRAGEAVRGRMPAPRRAMPVAPKAPMVERGRRMPAARRAPRGEPIMAPYMPTYTAPTREESEAYMRQMGIVPSAEARYAKGGRVSKGEKKIGKVMGEFKRGELHSGSKKGPVVKNPKQAVAIALSEARSAGAKIPKKKAMGGRACD